MTVEGPLRTNHSGALELCQGLLIVGVIDRSALHGAVIRALVEELGQPAYGLKVAAVFDARARVTIDSATDPEDDVLELRRSLSSGGVDPFATHVGDALLYLPPYGARPTRWFLLSSLREVGWDEAAIPDGFQARGPLWVDLAP